MSDKTFRTFDNTVSEFTLRPTCPNIVYHDNIFYNIIVFDTETNAAGRAAELCQLSAIDKSGHCSFSEYILPNNCIDKYASRVNKLSVRTVNGQRTLFKEAQQVATLTSSEAISRFGLFLKSSVDYCKTLTDKDVCTLLVGHNLSKIAGSGLTYDDLLKLFKNFGKPGLISILSRPATKNGKQPRVTKTTRILTAIHGISKQFVNIKNMSNESHAFVSRDNLMHAQIANMSNRYFVALPQAARTEK